MSRLVTTTVSPVMARQLEKIDQLIAENRNAQAVFKDDQSKVDQLRADLSALQVERALIIGGRVWSKVTPVILKAFVKNADERRKLLPGVVAGVVWGKLV